MDMLPIDSDGDYLQDEYNKVENHKRELQRENEASLDKDSAVFNVEEVPKEMDIYYRDEASFLPEGKTFADLTPQELKRIKSQYRFSPLRPGLYQGITGIVGPGQFGF